MSTHTFGKGLVALGHVGKKVFLQNCSEPLPVNGAVDDSKLVGQPTTLVFPTVEQARLVFMALQINPRGPLK